MLNNLFKVGWKSKNADIICFLLTTLAFLQEENLKKNEKLIKIANIEEENLHNFWTTWGISVELSGKMWLMIILKVTKK